MLDSSPAPLMRRPLKRSASAASLASMPTPPRTHRRHARGRSRGSCDSDSDDHVDDNDKTVVLTDEEVEEDAHRAKKRRTGPAAAAVDEDAFWLSGAADGPSGTTITTSGNAATRSAKPQAPVAPPPLLYRRKAPAPAQSGEVAPVSPPPSHRRAVAIAPVTPEPPRTRAAARRALRDSPANPFLASPADPATDSATPSPLVGSSSASPKTPTMGEKPTMTYVFRGVRRVYQNPLYDHAAGRARSPPPASLLPIEDPEYSPAINCTPKMLFPAARRATRAKGKSAVATMMGDAKAKGGTKTKGRRVRSPSLSGDEIDAADLRPRKLAFGKRTLGEELVSAGEPLAL